ncbi:hypothetical protein [Oceanisphaera pacifica]|uniref:Uncharacterized protein n=1 Tax=Oceanisphaera pacifica TaxID=2818389 RepID=A0ABS3NDM1_9GAMM|nr:hypothetical protein [Oceanisphaera pacifica]MBO1518385.1 hypothetical protein [Oceanisphaera pacifica]
MNKAPYQRRPVRIFLLASLGLVIAGCNKSIDSQAVNTEAIARQHMPSALPVLTQYQAKPYQAKAQRDPFMTMFPDDKVRKPQPVIDGIAEPECEPSARSPATDLTQTWTLRATFNGGHSPMAIIDIPNTGTTNAIVGQQLTAQTTNQLQNPIVERIEVMAIKGQQVTLQHEQALDTPCPYTQIVTLNLYE